MADQVQELQDAVDKQGEKLTAIETGLADLVNDQKTAFEALKAQIGNNPDLAPAIAKVEATFPRMDALVSAIKSGDVDAEAISGVPTP